MIKNLFAEFLSPLVCHIDVIVLIEKLFGIKTAKEEFAGVKTFNDLYDFLGNRINK